jgi:hypothetical protein
LVLNGTVVARTWTVGMLDFLLEALDAWEAKKAEDFRTGRGPPVATHRVGSTCSAVPAREGRVAYARSEPFR